MVRFQCIIAWAGIWRHTPFLSQILLMHACHVLLYRHWLHQLHPHLGWPHAEAERAASLCKSGPLMHRALLISCFGSVYIRWTLVLAADHMLNPWMMDGFVCPACNTDRQSEARNHTCVMQYPPTSEYMGQRPNNLLPSETGYMLYTFTMHLTHGCMGIDIPYNISSSKYMYCRLQFEFKTNLLWKMIHTSVYTYMRAYISMRLEPTFASGWCLSNYHLLPFDPAFALSTPNRIQCDAFPLFTYISVHIQ